MIIIEFFEELEKGNIYAWSLLCVGILLILTIIQLLDLII